MKNGKLRVALVGVSFGAEFIPIYLKHPDVDSLVLVDTNEKLLNAVGDKFLLEERLTDFNAMLEDKTIDAVHLVTPPATHAPLSIQVMNAGKHCACTIPMGMSIDELYQVIDARKRSGKHYMFMETSVYGREFLYVKDLYEKGELGRIQFMRCAHYQDMEGWPDYWLGSYVMKRSVSVKFILTIAKSKEQNNRPLVESSLKTIFFFCLFSGFTQGGAVVSRKQNSQPKAIFFADVDAGKDSFISRKKKRKCCSCTKRKSKDQISDSADGF